MSVPHCLDTREDYTLIKSRCNLAPEKRVVVVHQIAQALNSS